MHSNIISNEIKDKLLAEIGKKLNPNYRHLFEDLRDFQAIHDEYTKKRYEKSLIIKGKSVAKKLGKKLESIINETFLQEVLSEQNSDIKNFKEILRENLYKSTMVSINEKSKLIKIIQKEPLTEEDKEELRHILRKLPSEELKSLLGKGYKQYMKKYWQTFNGFNEFINVSNFKERVMNEIRRLVPLLGATENQKELILEKAEGILDKHISRAIKGDITIRKDANPLTNAAAIIFAVLGSNENMPSVYNSRVEKKVLTGLKNEDTRRIINRITKKAKDKKINVKIFVDIATTPRKSKIDQVVFRKASLILEGLIDKSEFPRFVSQRKLIQLTVDGRGYLKLGDPEFERSKSLPYGGIVYDIVCKPPLYLYPFLAGRHYIGRTHKSSFKRMRGHIEGSLTSVKNTRLIEQAIIAALELEGYNIERLRIEYEALIPWMKEMLLNNLTEILLEKYFDIAIIEVHLNYHTTPFREKWYIKNLHHHVNGKLTIGTKKPNGLNMIESGGSTVKYIALPLYDIAFMVALGYSEVKIMSIINTIYELTLKRSNQVSYRIRDFFNSFTNAQILFMKPVVLEVLKKFPDISALELSKVFGYGKDFGNFKESIFRKFFEGASFKDIKRLRSRSDFNWNNLRELIRDYRDDIKIKGFSKNTWIEWLIKDLPNMKICERIGLNPRDSYSAQSSIEYILKNSDIGMSKREAVKYFRKLKTIDYKLKGKNIKWIYTVIFGLEGSADWSMRRFHDRLWGATISFDRLYDMSNPSELLDLKLKIA